MTRELARRGHRVTLLCQNDAGSAINWPASLSDVVRSTLRRWPPDELRPVARSCSGADRRHPDAPEPGPFLRRAAAVDDGRALRRDRPSRHFQLHWMFNDCVVAASRPRGHSTASSNLVRRKSRAVTIHNFADFRRLQRPAADARRRIRGQWGVGDDGAAGRLRGRSAAAQGQLTWSRRCRPCWRPCRTLGW